MDVDGFLTCKKQSPGGRFITGFATWGWVKTLVPSEPQNSWDLWMFIPLKMYHNVSIGIDPYPHALCQMLNQAPHATQLRPTSTVSAHLLQLLHRRLRRGFSQLPLGKGRFLVSRSEHDHYLRVGGYCMGFHGFSHGFPPSM